MVNRWARKFRPRKLLEIWEDPNLTDKELRYSDVYREAKKRFPEVGNLNERTFIRYVKALVDEKLLHRRIDKKRKTFYKPTSEALKEKTRDDMLQALASETTHSKIEFNLAFPTIRKPIVGPLVLPGGKITQSAFTTKNYVFAKTERKVGHEEFFSFVVDTFLWDIETYFPLVLASLPKDFLQNLPIKNTIYLTLKINYEIPSLEKLRDICWTYYHYVEAKHKGLKKRGFESTHEEIQRDELLPAFKKIKDDVEARLKNTMALPAP